MTAGETFTESQDALGRLLAALDTWSELDFLRDPHLDALLERLDADGRRRHAFLHARAGLLLTGAVAPRPAVPLGDWRPALTELLAADPPPAALRVHLQGDAISYAGLERPPFLVTQARVEQLKALRHPELYQLPPVGDVLLERQDKPLVAEGKGIKQGSLLRVKREEPGAPGAWRDMPQREEYKYQAPSMLLPLGPEAARDPAFWVEALAGSDFDQDSWQGRLPAPWPDERLIPGVLLQWQLCFLDLLPWLWEEADRELALAWLALRLALESPQAIRLPEGAVLLRLGGPFFAELRLFPLVPSPGARPVRGALHLDITYGGVDTARDMRRVMRGRFAPLTETVSTHTVSGGYELGAKLPRRLYLLGERFGADIRFRGSALFAETPPSLSQAAAAARLEDARRRLAAEDADEP